MAGLITVGVDGSEPGREALRFALAESRLRHARLRAVHAWSIPSPALGGVSMLPVLERAQNELAAASEATLREELRRVGADGADVEVERWVLASQPAAALLQAAAGADLLVLGSRGHGPVVGPLLGSVSLQCLHHAACPVAVVHANDRADRRRITVGVDGSPGAAKALAWALEEARLRGTTVHAVCAYGEPWGVAVGGVGAAGALAGLRESLAREAQRVLEDAVRSAAGSVPVSTQAVRGPADDVLLAAAADCDLLVVGSRGRGGFASLLLGSVGQSCAARTTSAVVVVPRGRDAGSPSR